MNVEQLEALAVQCEQASGPDRALDCAIAVAAAGFIELPPAYDDGETRYGYRDGPGIVSPGQAHDMLVPRYTASVDAALTLVPEMGEKGWGEYVSLSLWDTNGVYSEHVRASAWVRGAPRVYAATPALAITAAALRARSA